MALLDKVKVACRVTTTAYDEELSDLICAGVKDIGITDVRDDLLTDVNHLPPLIQRAVITYCRLNFGEPDDYDRIKRSYDEQKAQMLMSSSYTNWGDTHG